MKSYVFWDKIIDLHEDFELDGIEKYIILDMNGGVELILAISTIDVLESEDVFMGVLEDGTEILISIPDICCLRFNPVWDSIDSVLNEEGVT